MASLEAWIRGLVKLNIPIDIFTTSLVWRNAFSVNRLPLLRWFQVDLGGPVVSAKDLRLFHLCAQSFDDRTLTLYSGDENYFSAVLNRLHGDISPIPGALLVMLPGHLRLSVLSGHSFMDWQKIKHQSVGGATSGQFWFGSLTGHPPSHRDVSPTYCRLSMMDILEFAPAQQQVTPLTATGVTSRLAQRQFRCVPFDMPNTFVANGLSPALGSLQQPFWVVAKTPFSPTGIGRRLVTIAEITKLMDLSVSATDRLCRLLPDPIRDVRFSDLFGSIPVKVLLHGLWLSGFVSCSNDAMYGRGESMTQNLSQELSKSAAFIRETTLSHSLWVHENEFHHEHPSEVDIKAVKCDDALVPVGLWNNRLIDTLVCVDKQKFLRALAPARLSKALNGFRTLALRWWIRCVRRSLVRYLRITWKDLWTRYVGEESFRDRSPRSNFTLDIDGGLDCLIYAVQATWWEWSGGSRPFFWRWSPEFRMEARDGVAMYWVPGKLPNYKRPPRLSNDPVVINQMKTKVDKVRRRGYLRKGRVKSLINYFAVPKGTNDVRMVYDGTACGFNDAVWVPNFGLPTINTLLRGTGPNTWMVDLDIGDMFLNFMLHFLARTYVGIDITKLSDDTLDDVNDKTVWLQWSRCAMGLKTSPHQAIKAVLFAEEFIKGFPTVSSNPFQYHHVNLNIPGSASYDPSKAWYSVADVNDNIAVLLAIYVDDQRIHSPTEKGAWEAAHVLATRESYLGIQDAARKRRPPSKAAGAWAGSIIRTNSQTVGKMISQDRWTKTKSILGKWNHRLHVNDEPKLDLKELLSDRGFLIYVSRTYTTMTTFLKGFHLTIESWREDRDDDGWKIPNFYEEKSSSNFSSPDNGQPSQVAPARRLKDDLKVLLMLTREETPPVCKVFSSSIYIVKYGFGDASGGGFGSSLTTVGNQMVNVYQGTWGEGMKTKSSNFKEFGNFVAKLLLEGKHGRLDGAEIFLFTDNSTTESAFANGTTKSKTLFELVVKMKVLEMKHSVKLHLIHVSGKRMISQGTDGISRGSLIEGVLAGKSMMSFVPIAKSAVDRHDNLITWIRTWTSVNTLQALTPKEWLWEGHGLSPHPWKNCDGMNFPMADKSKSVLLWAPAPAIADVALEELRRSRHKRPDLCHIVVIPKLMTPLWRKVLLRTCCFSFYVDPGPTYWPSEMFEPLLIGVYLPYIHCFPWTYRGSNSILELERKLSEVQKGKHGCQRDILLKFFGFTRKISMLPSSVVRKMLFEGSIR